MKAQNRMFSWRECRQRINALNDTFFLLTDCEENQTGSGKEEFFFYDELKAIHEGSVAMEAPLTLTFGAVNSVKRGSVHKVKEHGSSTPNAVVDSTPTSNSSSSRGRRRRSWEGSPLFSLCIE